MPEIKTMEQVCGITIDEIDDMRDGGTASCVGSVRGSCDVQHRTATGALRCLYDDAIGCSSQGGYSDRVLCIETTASQERDAKQAYERGLAEETAQYAAMDARLKREDEA